MNPPELCNYIEHNPDLHVDYIWKDCRKLVTLKTARGTLVEIVDRPAWGLSCFMDGVVQSCEKDEKIYHEALVGSALKLMKVQVHAPQICVFGGGEGATARDIWWQSPAAAITMIEWDREIVELFQTRFQGWSNDKWGNCAWEDPRLRIEYEDAFEIVKESRDQAYDLVLVDLFDVEEAMLEKWKEFMDRSSRWTRNTYCMYVATHSPFVATASGLCRKLRRHLKGLGFATKYTSVYVPSFHGYAIFLLGKRIPTVTTVAATV
jgi:spermidine synthase